jgi:YVTN family beta-propeller protein
MHSNHSAINICTAVVIATSLQLVVARAQQPSPANQKSPNEPQEYATGLTGVSIPIASDGAHVWISDIYGGLSALNADSGALEWNQQVAGHPGGLIFDGTNLWVTVGGDFVSVVRATDGKILKIVPLGAPWSDKIVFDGENVWVAGSVDDNNGGSVSGLAKVRASDGSVLGSYKIDKQFGNIWGLAFDGTSLWLTTSSSKVIKVNPRNFSTLGVFPVGPDPISMAFDGSNAWVIFKGGIAELRLKDGQRLGTFTTESPSGIAFDGSNIWITNWEANTVTKLRASDRKVLDTLPVGGKPCGIVFAGKHIWISNCKSHTVAKF